MINLRAFKNGEGKVNLIFKIDRMLLRTPLVEKILLLIFNMIKPEVMTTDGRVFVMSQASDTYEVLFRLELEEPEIYEYE